MRWWTIAINCLYLLVIAYVFNKLDSRPLIVTIAVLGLVYVSIRTMMMSHLLYIAEMFAQTNQQLLWVRKLLKDPTYQENQEAWDKAEKTEKPKRLAIYYTDMGFLGIIGIYCLVVLFIHL